MKKIFAIILAFTLSITYASADVVYGGSYEAVKTAAEQLASSLGTHAIGYDTQIDAVNAALSDNTLICVSTQQIMIDGLQGYSNSDLRTALTFAAFPAVSDYYLVCSPETEEIYGDFASIGEFLEENEYKLIIARTMFASNVDYVATKLCDEFFFDQELFFDEDEVLEMLTEGAYIYIVNESNIVNAKNAGFVVMGELNDILDGIFGDVICVSAVNEINVDVSVFDLAANGYRAFDANGISTVDYANGLFKEYLAYMTAEGLCFYEE